MTAFASHSSEKTNPARKPFCHPVFVHGSNGAEGRHVSQGAGIFRLSCMIRNFTYEMADLQGKVAMEGNVIKLGFENN